MAVLEIFIYLCMLWQPIAGQMPGVYLWLNGTRYANESEILISEIGRVNNSQALQCVTDKRPCCKTNTRIGQWYFPNGMTVSVQGAAQFFYRNRGDDGTVNLNRVSDDVKTPTGQFCCVVPDMNDTSHTLCVNIVSELTSSTLHENLPGDSGYFPYIIGGSIAGAVAVSIIITIPATVVIFVLALRYCRKKRLPREHKYTYPPSAVRYTSQRNARKEMQQSDSDIDNIKKSSGDVYINRTVAKNYDFDAQEEYDDILKSETGTKYQNQTRIEAVAEEEYDDIIKSGISTEYQNQTRTKGVMDEEHYDDIIKSGTGTIYQNQTWPMEEVIGEEYDDIVHH